MVGFSQAYLRGQTHVQIGDNTNLFDWTYVGNVAHAHLLAADKLETPPPAPPLASLEKVPLSVDDLPPLSDAEEALVDYPVLPVDLTTGHYKTPTCEARPLGPYITPPPNAEKIKAAFEDQTPDPNRPIIRNRFDQMSEYALQRAKLHNPEVNPLQVAGQVFFITNGEPVYFWDFPRMIWNELDKHFPGHRQQRAPFVLSRSIGLAAATGSEWYGYLSGKDVTFTKMKVTYTCTTRYHNIEKARRVLGYEPLVSVEEGVKRAVEVRVLCLALSLQMCLIPLSSHGTPNMLPMARRVHSGPYRYYRVLEHFIPYLFYLRVHTTWWCSTLQHICNWYMNCHFSQPDYHLSDSDA